MSKDEQERFGLIKKALGPAVKIYELTFVVISETEWGATIALVGGGDKRFRFTRGQLFDEAAIGDVRV